ncbi:MAG: hypothetical protein ABFD64_01875 [Armatimonadota bacterium]
MKKLYLITIVVLMLIALGLWIGIHETKSQGRAFSFKVMAPLPTNSRYWTIYWAGGLITQGGDSKSQYFFVKDKLIQVGKTLPDAVVLSSYCKDKYLFSWFGEPRSEYLGVFDLDAGKAEKIISHDNATFIENTVMDSGCNWSPDYRTLIAWAREDGRVEPDTLAFVDRASGHIRKWKAHSGVVKSTAWPESEPRTVFILTVRPGALYSVNTTNINTKSVLRLPNLDASSGAVLSPKGDRAIGFGPTRSWADGTRYKDGRWTNYFHFTGTFYLDFKHQTLKRPLKTADGQDMSKLMIDSAFWSPNGTKLAVLAYGKTNTSPHLYIGDPAKSLTPVRLSRRYRFVGYNDKGLTDHQLAWDQDNTCLYAVVIDKLAGLEGKVQYIIIKINTQN